MYEFTVNQEFVHPDHGPCTVVFVGKDYVGIETADGRNALLRKEGLASALAVQEVAASLVPEALGNSQAQWPDDTFVQEPEDAEHAMGSHWSPFVDEPKAMLERLPELVPEAKVAIGYGEFFKPTRSIPQSWVRGAHLAWPDIHRGLMLTLRIETDENCLSSIYPYCEEGCQVRLELQRVIVWKSGVEAQIEAAWGEAEITFFDSLFLVNRLWYEAGRSYDFILTAIAYEAGPAPERKLPYNPNPDQVAWERTLAEKRGELPPSTPEFIDLSDMAALLPIPEWEADDYSFIAPVKAVQTIESFLDQPCWRVRVAVMRFGDEDAELDIIVTRKAWNAEQPPLIGGQIEGRFWLQGRLWSVADGGAK